MDVLVKGRNMPVTEALEQYATEKVERTAKFFDEERSVARAEVELIHERNPSTPEPEVAAATLRRPADILEALMRRVGRQEAVQCGGAGARQTGDEDGSGDRNVPVLGMLRPGGFREQTRDQRTTKEHPRHLAAERGECFVPRVRLEQYLECLEVLVLAEIRQARHARRRGMQVLGGAHGGAFAHLVSRSVVVFAAVDVDALPGDRRRHR